MTATGFGARRDQTPLTPCEIEWFYPATASGLQQQGPHVLQTATPFVQLHALMQVREPLQAAVTAWPWTVPPSAFSAAVVGYDST